MYISIKVPYKFILSKDSEPQFQGTLKKLQCTHTNPRTSVRCRRFQIIGCGLCWQHLESDRHLKIKKSTLPNAGLGLLAYNRTNNRDILLRAGDSIIKYDAERLTDLQLNRRYGDDATAPYAVRVNRNIVEDGES